MTQEDPLTIFAYDIDVLPLIKLLKLEYPDPTQPWYAYNARAIAMYKNIKSYLNMQKKSACVLGITPNPKK